jgi:hypothetical protein
MCCVAPALRVQLLRRHGAWPPAPTACPRCRWCPSGQCTVTWQLVRRAALSVALPPRCRVQPFSCLGRKQPQQLPRRHSSTVALPPARSSRAAYSSRSVGPQWHHDLQRRRQCRRASCTCKRPATIPSSPSQMMLATPRPGGIHAWRPTQLIHCYACPCGFFRTVHAKLARLLIAACLWQVVSRRNGLQECPQSHELCSRGGSGEAGSGRAAHGIWTGACRACPCDAGAAPSGLW